MAGGIRKVKSLAISAPTFAARIFGEMRAAKRMPARGIAAELESEGIKI